jgi:Leucine-rich repeat (LRR) protein
MSNLKHLTTLALDDNSFTGDMASVVNGLVNLKYLYVDNNSFDNTIDDLFLAANTHLEEIDMSGNRFATNDLPAHLFLMVHLRVLDLHNNDLAGRLPNDIPKQASLEILDLSSNRFSGTMPSSIQQLSSLTQLDVSSNQFTGLIPYTFSSMRNLSSLSLSNNPLDEDPFPEFVAFLTNLKELSMAKTGRRGILPNWLDRLSNLVLLDLSENELTGTIPDSIWDLADLKYLLLQRNQLEGSVSKGLLRSENLGKFEMRNPQ